MTTIGNILWFILGGIIAGTLWMLAGAVFCLTVVGIPFGLACFRIAVFAYAPFGKELVDARDVGEERLSGTGFANFLWFALAGLWLWISFVLAGISMLIGIVTIPFGFAYFKLATAAFAPLGKRIVSGDMAHVIRQRKASGQLDDRLSHGKIERAREVPLPGMASRTEKRESEREFGVRKPIRHRSTARSLARRRTARAVRNVLLALLALAALAGAVPASRWFFRRAVSENDFFTLRHADVLTDGILTANHILAAAGVSVGTNLFAFSVDGVRDRIAADPLVQSATVVRRIPDTLLVSVVERRPVARITGASETAPLAIDDTGHVLGPSALRSALPTLSGLSDTVLAPGDVVSDPLLPRLLDILSICNHPEIRDATPPVRPIRLDVSDRTRILMTLDNGENVFLSTDGYADKIRRLVVMRRVASERSLPLRNWDLTADRSYPATP